MADAGDRVIPVARSLAAALARISPLTLDSGRALAVTALAQALALALQLLLARSLGPAEFGAYSVAIAMLGIGLIFARCGLDTALVRQVAVCRSRGDQARLAAVVGLATRVAPLLGAAVGIAACTMTAILSPPVPVGLLVLVAVLLPVAARSEINAAALRGLRRIGLALAGDGCLRPVVAMAVVVWVATAAPHWLGTPVALAAYAIGTCLSALLTSVVLRRVVGRSPPAAAWAEGPAMLRLGFSLMVANGALVAMYALDTPLLALLRSPAEAGFFSVASRMALFVLFVMNAVQLAAAPRLAAAATDPVRLRAVVRGLNRMAATAGLAVAALLFAAAEPLLGLFGPEFVAGAPSLRILAAAQALNVLTGPTGILLSMTGRERPYALLLVSGLVVQVSLALWLIPLLGASGAATAGLIAHLSWNLAAVLVLRREFGIDVTVFDLLRPAR